MTQATFLHTAHPGNKSVSGFCSNVPYCGVIHSLHHSLNNLPTGEKNFSFIDIQNLYQGIKERGWKINWHLFRQYLHKKYNVVKAVVFIGFVKGNEWLYAHLRNAGFELSFKETRILKNGQLDNGNCDCELVSYALDAKSEYTKAVIVADDSDYLSTIQRLSRQNKLKLVISSHLLSNTSQQIKRNVSSDMLISIHSLRNQISIINKK